MHGRMKVVAVIQARMGSSRLPGKVMLPLAGEHVLTHDVRRVNAADTVDETIVATSTGQQDDIIATYGVHAGATITRGSETDVLGRLFQAAREADANVVVRVTGDCPLVVPKAIDAAVARLRETGADYASTTIERTLPRGLGAEVFTFDSFKTVADAATEAYEREHVTPRYYEHLDEFDVESVTSAAVFDAKRYRDRTDLRLTLDEAADYELLRRIYEGIEWSGIVDIRDAIDYVDDEGLSEVNVDVEQKSYRESEADG